MSALPAPSRLPRPSLRGFLGVPLRVQTYKNLLYLALSFPLGITYFAVLTVAISMGVSLSVLLVGVPLLVATLFLSNALAVVERGLATHLLGVDVPADRGTGESIEDRIRTTLTDLGTWTGLVYLASKFFLGVGTFVFLTVGFTIAASLAATPLYYQYADVGLVLSEPATLSLGYAVTVLDGAEFVHLPITIASRQVTTMSEALVVSVLGVLLGLAFLHACNCLAWLQGEYARRMLRTRPLADYRPNGRQ
jgi:hypothetical protein